MVLCWFILAHVYVVIAVYRVDCGLIIISFLLDLVEQVQMSLVIIAIEFP